jgi:type VI secretion system secreted protein Hcp
MASDFYLKIPNIPGEAKEERHREWIEVDSWSFGISNNSDPGRGSGATKSVANFTEFSFTKRNDRSSPRIFQTICSGMHIPELTFGGQKAGAKQGIADYLILRFRDCIISSLQQSGGGAADVMPSESVSFSFSQIEFEYQQVDVKGNLSPAAAFKYDLKSNMVL